MKVSQALLQRRSTRAFLPKTVEHAKITQILEHAKWSPSGVNMQPWKVYVVTGQAKQQLSNLLLSAFESGKRQNMDYPYYPSEWKVPFKQRRVSLGMEMFSLLNIARDDKDARVKQWGRNYLAFDAPCMLIFSIDSSLKTGSYLDYGMFLQSIMLMAEELSLSTCPQAALAEYPDILRNFFKVDATQHFICGIALGYADTEATVNQLKPSRAEIESFTTFID